MRVKLEEVCKRIYAGGDVPKDRYSEVKTKEYPIPIYANAEKDNGLYGYTDKAREEELSITVAARGTIGFTAIRREPFLPVVRLITVVPDTAKVSERYLYYVLKNCKPQSSGTSIPQLTVPDIKKNRLELYDISEQERIADQLDTVSKVIELRKQELEALDNLIKARFVEMFGIPIANTNNWPMDKAENLCTLVTDGSHFSPKACEEGYPMLSVKDMRQNGFDYSDCKLVDDETFEILKKQGCVPQADDVLIAKDGSYFTRAFAITEYKDQAILSSIGMYRPDIDKILPRFLASYLMTNEVIEFVNRGYVTGTALRRVIIKGLKNIPVYMPPMELQKEFVQFAEQVDKSKVVVKKALEQAQLLFDSLMQEYFG